MMHRPYKFLVIPVIQVVNDEGVVIDEMSPEQPTAVFGINGLKTFAENFELSLAAQTQDGRANADQRAG